MANSMQSPTRLENDDAPPSGTSHGLIRSKLLWDSSTSRVMPDKPPVGPIRGLDAPEQTQSTNTLGLADLPFEIQDQIFEHAVTGLIYMAHISKKDSDRQCGRLDLSVASRKRGSSPDVDDICNSLARICPLAYVNHRARAAVLRKFRRKLGTMTLKGAVAYQELLRRLPLIVRVIDMVTDDGDEHRTASSWKSLLDLAVLPTPWAYDNPTPSIKDVNRVAGLRPSNLSMYGARVDLEWCLKGWGPVASVSPKLLAMCVSMFRPEHVVIVPRPVVKWRSRRSIPSEDEEDVQRVERMRIKKLLRRWDTYRGVFDAMAGVVDGRSAVFRAHSSAWILLPTFEIIGNNGPINRRPIEPLLPQRHQHQLQRPLWFLRRGI